MYPAKYPEVIAVGAHDEFGEMATFSNMGPEVDLIAPGVNIVSTNIASESVLGLCSGTSMAAPQVTAAIAMMLAYDQQLGNMLGGPEQVKEILKQASDDMGQGIGEINLINALDAVAALNGQ